MLGVKKYLAWYKGSYRGFTKYEVRFRKYDLRFTRYDLRSAKYDLRSTTANKVDNLKAVSIFHNCGFPLSTTNNLAIEFYGHAIGFHCKLFDDESGKRQRRLRELLGLSIDDQVHFLK